MDKKEKEFLVSFYNALLEDFSESFMFENFISDPSYENFRAWKDEMDDSFSLDKRYFVNCGLTKGVIIHEDLDWVLKIPFGYQKNNMNHCKAETEYYQAAIEAGIQDMFAESHYLMTFLDVPCYVMRKVECGECALDSNGSTLLGCDEYSYSRDESESEDLVEELLSAYYGDRVFSTYCHFCRCNHINDVHEDNIGWIGTQPVVIDYSGF